MRYKVIEFKGISIFMLPEMVKYETVSVEFQDCKGTVSVLDGFVSEGNLPEAIVEKVRALLTLFRPEIRGNYALMEKGLRPREFDLF